MRKLDLTGMKYGILTVLSFSHTSQNKKTFFLCECECGNEKAVYSHHLRSGHTTSCGCKKAVKQTHGKSRTRLYTIWTGMLKRCRDKKSKDYIMYGSKGVTVCGEWSDFEAFHVWALNNGYMDNLTIDRIDNTGNYEPHNCRWATNLEQQSNRTNNKYITANGTTRSISEWSKATGLPYSTIWNRIFNMGWSPEKTMTIPKRPKKRTAPINEGHPSPKRLKDTGVSCGPERKSILTQKAAACK